MVADSVVFLEVRVVGLVLLVLGVRGWLFSGLQQLTNEDVLLAELKLPLTNLERKT